MSKKKNQKTTITTHSPESSPWDSVIQASPTTSTHKHSSPSPEEPRLSPSIAIRIPEPEVEVQGEMEEDYKRLVIDLISGKDREVFCLRFASKYNLKFTGFKAGFPNEPCFILNE